MTVLNLKSKLTSSSSLNKRKSTLRLTLTKVIYNMFIRTINQLMKTLAKSFQAHTITTTVLHLITMSWINQRFSKTQKIEILILIQTYWAWIRLIPQACTTTLQSIWKISLMHLISKYRRILHQIWIISCFSLFYLFKNTKIKLFKENIFNHK